ncbi:hypothetical protein V5O48_017383 [Marasmius crinis-equi]|uniref:4-coumarate--CoA ligase n=1 Tax=Marasmius crinis-equi TaxID=585013 RepID=A0ABR3EP43_9AGAR
MTFQDIPHIPEDISVPQFIFGTHGIRPFRPENVPWLVDDETGVEFGGDQVKERTRSLSAGLQRRFGLKPDDVVVIFSGNHIDYPICIWAIQYFLGIVAPTNPGFTVPELTTHLRSVKPSLVITHSEVLPTVENAMQQVGLTFERMVVIDAIESSGDSKYISISELIQEGRSIPGPPVEYKLAPGENKKKIAFYNTSSGTTGSPKVVKISHYAAIANVLLTAAHNKVHVDYTAWEEKRYRVGNRCFAVLPFYHIYGLDVVLHFNIFAGLTIVIAPKFNFTNMLESIVRHRITHLMIVPPQVVLLCKDPVVKNYDLSGVRVVLCAGSALPGSTEVTGIASMCPITSKQNPHGGTFLPGVEGRVVRPDGSVVVAAPNDHEVGELLIRTVSATAGYLDNEDATRETFLEDGWIRSGDIVRIDTAGNIIVVDRVKEMIKVRSFQVAPAELEGTILDTVYADDACVVPVPDLYSGELPLAYVVPSQLAKEMIGRGESTEVRRGIIEHVARNKARFKHLARVEFVETIPKTPSGKILRRDLRQRARELVGGQAKL